MSSRYVSAFTSQLSAITQNKSMSLPRTSEYSAKCDLLASVLTPGPSFAVLNRTAIVSLRLDILNSCQRDRRP